jgi:hypothetical protein
MTYEQLKSWGDVLRLEETIRKSFPGLDAPFDEESLIPQTVSLLRFILINLF